MITYVNTVLVGKKDTTVKTIELNGYDSEFINDTEDDAKAKINTIYVCKIDDAAFKVGMVIGVESKLVYDKDEEDYVEKFFNTVRWSNNIKKDDIKGMVVTNFNDDVNEEDQVTIDFENVVAEDLAGKRIVVRLTFKDLPTRYRKWTESYEIMVGASDDAAAIAKKVKKEILRNNKRARVTVKVEGAKVILTAMKYTDDNTKDSISPANKVRFSVNMWMTDPQAAGFASKNKYSVDGAVIKKEPGIAQVGEWKLVRDAEAGAMGYLGILNRGECTWPIIKPDMNVEAGKTYNTATLEFENMYRTADDLFRKTKQTLQVYLPTDGAAITTLTGAISDVISAKEEDIVTYNTASEKLA